MKWDIAYSRDAERFVQREGNREDVRKELVKFLKKMKGEKINVDVKKLKGVWEGYYRLRKGRLRIIFSLDYKETLLFIDRIDFRGEVYR